MTDLVLPVDRTALCLVEMQNDIVHESNIGERGLGGVLAKQVEKRSIIKKLVALTAAARARGVPVLYINFCGKPGFPRPNTRLHRVSGSKPRLTEARTMPSTARLVDTPLISMVVRPSWRSTG